MVVADQRHICRSSRSGSKQVCRTMFGTPISRTLDHREFFKGCRDSAKTRIWRIVREIRVGLMQFAHRVQEMFKTLASTSEIFGPFPGVFYCRKVSHISQLETSRPQPTEEPRKVLNDPQFGLVTWSLPR